MDNDRTLRNLIPPLVLVASIVWVNLLESGWAAFQSEEVGATVAALLAGGAAVVALGFVLSSASVWLLRAWSRRHFGKPIDIAGFADDVSARFGAHVGISSSFAVQHQLPSAVLYDHWIVREKHIGVHEWAARRWNVFHVSIHCCLALVFAHVGWIVYHVARGANWTPSWVLAFGWWLPDILLFGCMFANAKVAFHENRELFKVLVELPEFSDAGMVPAGAAEQGAAPVGAAEVPAGSARS